MSCSEGSRFAMRSRMATGRLKYVVEGRPSLKISNPCLEATTCALFAVKHRTTIPVLVSHPSSLPNNSQSKLPQLDQYSVLPHIPLKIVELGPCDFALEFYRMKGTSRET